jgi:hypothetical protein
LNWNPLIVIWNEVRERYLIVFGVTSPVALSRFKAIFLISIVTATAAAATVRGLRARRPVRLLLYLWAAYFAILCVFNQKLAEYLVHIAPWYAALFAVWILWLWDRGRGWRIFGAGWVTVMLLLQPAGILVKSAMRSFHAEMDPAVGFLKEHTADATLVFGSASLLYSLDYDPRLRDDPYLGVRSGRRAGAVVIEETYELLYSAWKTERPEDYEKIMAALGTYEKAYDHGGYRIYLDETKNAISLEE